MIYSVRAVANNTWLANVFFTAKRTLTALVVVAFELEVSGRFGMQQRMVTKSTSLDTIFLCLVTFFFRNVKQYCNRCFISMKPRASNVRTLPAENTARADNEGRSLFLVIESSHSLRSDQVS